MSLILARSAVRLLLAAGIGMIVLEAVDQAKILAEFYKHQEQIVQETDAWLRSLSVTSTKKPPHGEEKR